MNRYIAYVTIRKRFVQSCVKLRSARFADEEIVAANHSSSRRDSRSLEQLVKQAHNDIFIQIT